MRDYKSRSSTLYLRGRRKGIPRPLLVGLLAVLAIGAGLGVWALLRGQSPDQSPPAPTARPSPPPPKARVIPLRLPPPTPQVAPAEGPPAADRVND